MSSLDKLRVFRSSYLAAYEDKALEILEVGSAAYHGHAVNRDLLLNAKWRYRGLDLAAGPNVDVIATNPYDWQEMAEASVDVVVCSQVLEHARYVWLSMLEIGRVLKPRGVAFVIAPSGGQVHRYPEDCWRFYPDGLPALIEFAGLRLVEAHRQTRPVYQSSNAWRDALVVAQRPERNTEEDRLVAHKTALAKASLMQKEAVAVAPPPARAPAAASCIQTMQDLAAFEQREEALAGKGGWRRREAMRLMRMASKTIRGRPVDGTRPARTLRSEPVRLRSSSPAEVRSMSIGFVPRHAV